MQRVVGGTYETMRLKKSVTVSSLLINEIRGATIGTETHSVIAMSIFSWLMPLAGAARLPPRKDMMSGR